MDAENENDHQPNTSSASSSINSSSSNLLVNLPLLHARDIDNDDDDDDIDDNNELDYDNNRHRNDNDDVEADVDAGDADDDNEVEMPLQSHSPSPPPLQQPSSSSLMQHANNEQLSPHVHADGLVDQQQQQQQPSSSTTASSSLMASLLAPSQSLTQPQQQEQQQQQAPQLLPFTQSAQDNSAAFLTPLLFNNNNNTILTPSSTSSSTSASSSASSSTSSSHHLNLYHPSSHHHHHHHHTHQHQHFNEQPQQQQQLHQQQEHSEHHPHHEHSPSPSPQQHAPSHAEPLSQQQLQEPQQQQQQHQQQEQSHDNPLDDDNAIADTLDASTVEAGQHVNPNVTLSTQATPAAAAASTSQQQYEQQQQPQEQFHAVNETPVVSSVSGNVDDINNSRVEQQQQIAPPRSLPLLLQQQQQQHEPEDHNELAAAAAASIAAPATLPFATPYTQHSTYSSQTHYQRHQQQPQQSQPQQHFYQLQPQLQQQQYQPPPPLPHYQHHHQHRPHYHYYHHRHHQPTFTCFGDCNLFGFNSNGRGEAMFSYNDSSLNPGGSHSHSAIIGGSNNSGTSASGGGIGVCATNHHHQQQQQQQQMIDRLKLLYPNVNENETPLPRCWSPQDKCQSIMLSQNNLRVHYKGTGKQHNDAASVRTAYPIPPACGIYYFEVKIISKGKNGYMGIGLTAQQFRMNRLPGWDKQSYGYHGDDGHSFSSSGNGQSYGPTFTTGDVIGCCVNFVENTCSYTKNGIDLGVAFRDLPTKLYPTVGLQTPGEEVDANFGQEPFEYDQIEDLMKQARAQIRTAIYDFPMPVDQGDPTTLLHKMVSTYLVHNGYSQTAEAFARYTGQTFREDLSSVRNRQKILKLIMAGKMGQAIECTLRLYPGLLENNKNLWFMLKCRQFVEMINGSDVECCSTSTTTTNNNNHNNNNKLITNSTTTQTQTTATTTTPPPPNQTSVIQSTKSYQNGKSFASNTATTATTTTTPTSTTPTTTTTTNSAVIQTDNHNNDVKNSPANTGENNCNDNVGGASGDNSVVNSNKTNEMLAANLDYLNDVEMENNGHYTNGNACKNGNLNTSLEVEEEEDMVADIDVTPATKKYSHDERILEFGRELSQMGQQLENENKMKDEDRQMLDDAFSLMAYTNPWSSPLGWQLCPSKRETVCTALNSAILESMNYPRRPPLDICVAHASELLKLMAQASLGACAFINIDHIFTQN